MDEDNVIFEMQVERKVLEEVLNNNKNIQETYQLEAIIAKQKEEISKLSKSLTFNDASSKNELLIKISLLEGDKLKLSQDLDNERKSFALFQDNARKDLIKLQAEKTEIDRAKHEEEKKVAELSKALKLQQLKINNNNLAHVESKLLTLKLQSLENEKKYLLVDIENERKIIENQGKPRLARVEENIKVLRKWIEKEAKIRFPHESQEVKALKAKISSLEEDKANLIEGFELERKVFRKILQQNNLDIY